MISIRRMKASFMVAEYYILLFLTSFFVTELIECGIMQILFHSWKYTYYVFLCNLLTNPVLNLILVQISNMIPPRWYLPCLAVLEILVVLVEGFILHILCNFRKKKSLLLSLLLNGSSFVVGAILYRILLFNIHS